MALLKNRFFQYAIAAAGIFWCINAAKFAFYGDFSIVDAYSYLIGGFLSVAACFGVVAAELQPKPAPLSTEELARQQRVKEEQSQEKKFQRAARLECKRLMKDIPEELAIQNRLQHQIAVQTGTKGKRKIAKIKLRDALIRHTGIAFPLSSRDFPYGVGYHHLLDENTNAVRNLELGIHRACDTAIDPIYKQAFLLVSFRNAMGGLPLIVHWGKVIHSLADAGRFEVILGIDKDGKILLQDLTEWPHGLILGGTGNGKTTFMRQALTTLIRRNTKNDCLFMLLDLKGLDFGEFRDLPHVIDYINDPDAAIDALGDLVAELDRRRDLLIGQARTIDQWNKRHPKEPLPRIWLWCDELAILTRGGDKSRAKKAVTLILQLVTTGRAFGVHVVLGTQTISKYVVPMDIVANVDGRVCFGVRNTAASILAIGNKDAVGLAPPGRAAIIRKSITNFIQTPIATDAEITNAIKMAKLGRVFSLETIVAPEISTQRPKWADYGDIAHYAIENAGGVVNADRIWEENRGRMSRDKIRELVQNMDGQYFRLNGSYAYQMPPGEVSGYATGRTPRRIILAESLANRPDRLIAGLAATPNKGLYE